MFNLIRDCRVHDRGAVILGAGGRLPTAEDPHMPFAHLGNRVIGNEVQRTRPCLRRLRLDPLQALGEHLRTEPAGGDRLRRPRGDPAVVHGPEGVGTHEGPGGDPAAVRTRRKEGRHHRYLQGDRADQPQVFPKPDFKGGFGGMGGVGGGVAAPAPPAGEITEHKRIGAHDISVALVLDGARFVAWAEEYLEKQGVDQPKIPEPLKRVIGEYIADGYDWFVFDVVELGEETVTKDAIQYRFKTPALYYPLRITRAETGDTKIRLLISAHAGVGENAQWLRPARPARTSAGGRHPQRATAPGEGSFPIAAVGGDLGSHRDNRRRPHEGSLLSADRRRHDNDDAVGHHD